MRLAAGLLAVLLAPSLALAEDEAPSSAPAPVREARQDRQKVSIRVVRIMPETNQALMYDRTGGGTYLLVTVGEKIGSYTVESIDDGEVTLSASDRQIVLAAPDQPWRRRGGEGRTPAEPRRAARGDEPAPAAPYGGGPGPADPYVEEIREVKAPSAGAPAPADPPTIGAPSPADPYAEEIREVKAPSWLEPTPTPAPVTATPPAVASAPVATPAPATMPAPAEAPAPAVPPAPAAPASAPAADTAPVLARRELDAALADFGALAVAFRASFTPAGVQVESVQGGSVFAKAGLRAGDVIASVDGAPLRSLDDVAALYARAGTLRTVTAQVVRGGKPLTLRVVIQ